MIVSSSEVGAKASVSWKADDIGAGVEIDDGGSVGRGSGGGPGAGLIKAHVKWAAASSRGGSDSVSDGVVGGHVAGPKERAQDATRHYGRGPAFAEVGNYDRALICFNQALSLVSTQAPIWHGRGASLLGLRRYRDAVASFSQACALALTEELQLANGASTSLIDLIDLIVMGLPRLHAVNSSVRQHQSLHYAYS
jgi:tetratricopeptide (TPR) repeat protein